ncbi:hypothetical protein EZV62_026151 [Acer yangbiense]|uniref:PGG domain-containing protein n=1 Tax=Acer yangbiense TaxID=1000413 RepID=A0A5C7GQX9_9ROSI|nr:hypothetical protein EZV62_026151 [Acer yangbiense]
MGDSVFITNAYKNTVLHVAALNHNFAAVKLLVECNYDAQEQLVTRNRSGQTPLFKAASFGSTKVVRSDEQQIEKPEKVIHGSDDEQQTEKPEKVVNELDDDQELREIKIEDPQVETPLFVATQKGKIEIVKEILKEHPQAVEHVSHKMQNILHVAASYRQREVFELVKQMQIPTSNLILGIDAQSYTVLHHVADTKNYNDRNTRSGPPAYKLQEELEWFKSVKETMPSFFTEHRDKKDMTAKELFNEKHKNQLNEARKWIKDTSQSCSAVAVLIATVIFAAAYTVPGGIREETGIPTLGKHPLFLFFTTMDVISLSCSLTSVVTFLSMLTFPFELKDFRVSLPRRLTLGFTLLFIAKAEEFSNIGRPCWLLPPGRV